ncbi:hypothetical protein H257_14752 [Aphanomyces astaci]|uniref:Transposase Helix-turn-helix domain-containing protein n=1 Tax=Aphanomyces astaci TaxID=112090 RepID=W4FSM2_APHAT|nr:hypothetical protein H257_14752 [Aphanomyces astaci]ETV69613.1 hypothetical protein H257_14752 [Aphanomyces astaci]|eukprot:XP_009840940.1 hypothetical protein H257_14752 [Aphanomyces astaci]
MLLEFGLGIPVERPLIPAISFDVNMRDADAVLSFRFDVAGVLQLTSLLGVPNVVITSSRDRVTDVEAMVILLKRLRYPITFYDMLSTFGRSREQICRILNHMVAFVFNSWRDHLLQQAHCSCPNRTVCQRHPCKRVTTFKCLGISRWNQD